ncbi:MAG: sigma 54-dependent Fis family transcriptional regulator [Deltaproteobacteria bacterium]|nr:sigma 54-dependent Fis family transcriptional regulator [Deltaproteobacteria bacterium]
MYEDEENEGQRDTLIRLEPQLRWREGLRSHSRFFARRLVIGSADQADVVLHDPDVSRLHAALDVEDDGVWIRDLGSQSGTYVDGIRVLAARVPDAATIRVGSSELGLFYNQNVTDVELWPHDEFGPLLGRSAVMRALFARLHRVAQLESTVLIQGETGTGKELVARAIHDASPRRDRPFIVVDCGALAESLLEAELFGHTKGAFTGAASARSGAIETAGGGTVFLDEIGEMPLGMQPKLLRAIESRVVRRVGESTYREVNVRFIAATHRDLPAMVNVGTFREDLYFRLAVVPITIPPLRTRKEDIALIAQRMLPPGSPALSRELLVDLNRQVWPGNVRQLRNFMERTVALGDREAMALHAATSSRPPADEAPIPSGEFPSISADKPFKEIRDRWLDHLEREYMSAMLAKHGRDTSAIAQAAGLDRSYVYRLIRKHEL